MSTLPEYAVEFNSTDLWMLLQTVTRELQTAKTSLERLQGVESENQKLWVELEAMRSQDRPQEVKPLPTTVNGDGDAAGAGAVMREASAEIAREDYIDSSDNTRDHPVTNAGSSRRERGHGKIVDISPASRDVDNDRQLPSAMVKEVNDLPDVNKPRWQSILPCLPVDVEIPTTQIEMSLIATCNAKGPLYCHKRLIWPSPQHQHVFLASPMHQYHPGDDKHQWKRVKAHGTRVGQEHEIFYRGGDNVYYAGTYRCLERTKLALPQSPRSLWGCIVSDTLVDNSGPNGAPTPEARRTVNQAYLSGETKAAIFTLQCIGFNHRLHSTLLSRMSQKSGNKRKGGSSNHGRSSKAEHVAKKAKVRR